MKGESNEPFHFGWTVHWQRRIGMKEKQTRFTNNTRDAIFRNRADRAIYKNCCSILRRAI